MFDLCSEGWCRTTTGRLVLAQCPADAVANWCWSGQVLGVHGGEVDLLECMIPVYFHDTLCGDGVNDVDEWQIYRYLCHELDDVEVSGAA